MKDYAFTDPDGLLTIGAIAAALPVAVYAAHERLKRPPQDRTRAYGGRLSSALAALIPEAAPVELSRQLRCTLCSAGTLVTLAATPVVVLVVAWTAPRDPMSLRWFALNAIPYGAVLIGAFAMSATIKREHESRAIDLVRLTTQSPESIALAWFVAIAVPFVAAAALGAFALFAVDRPVFMLGWTLPALALAMPAIALCEGFQRRSPGAYIWGSFGVFAVATPFLVIQTFSIRGPRIAPAINGYVVFPILVTTLALGAAVGRLRRPDGPALAGGAAIAGVATMAMWLQSLPPMWPQTRLLAGLLAIAASFAAEERRPATAPGRRLAVTMTAAAIAATLVAAGGGGGPGTVAARLSIIPGYSLATTAALAGAGVAFAVGTGLLVHELTWRVPVASLALRVGIHFALHYRAMSIFWNPGPRIPLPAPWLGVGDVLALAAAFAIAYAAHARLRARDTLIAAPVHLS